MSAEEMDGPGTQLKTWSEGNPKDFRLSLILDPFCRQHSEADFLHFHNLLQDDSKLEFISLAHHMTILQPCWAHKHQIMVMSTLETSHLTLAVLIIRTTSKFQI